MLRKKRKYLKSVAETALSYVKSGSVGKTEEASASHNATGVMYSFKEKGCSSGRGRTDIFSKLFSHGSDYGYLSDQFSAMAGRSFSSELLRLIREKNMKDSHVYKTALIDRRLFSKIVSDISYSPSRDTCIAFAFALELSEEEATDLLGRAGYAFSVSSPRDIALRFLLRKRIRKVMDVNFILDEMNMKKLGR